LDLRQNNDALMVGRGSLEADRMTMTVPGQDRQPLRCIVSRSGNLPADHPIFTKPAGPIHLLITDNPANPGFPATTVHHATLPAFLSTLATAHHVNTLHCEGGGSLIHSLAALDAIDELHLTLAGHSLFGGFEAPTVTGLPGDFLPASLKFELTHFEPSDATGECFLSYRRRSQ
jgi:riboflavin biosynthesis pyrimidine reductase